MLFHVRNLDKHFPNDDSIPKRHSGLNYYTGWTILKLIVFTGLTIISHFKSFKYSDLRLKGHSRSRQMLS